MMDQPSIFLTRAIHYDVIIQNVLRISTQSKRNCDEAKFLLIRLLSSHLIPPISIGSIELIEKLLYLSSLIKNEYKMNLEEVSNIILSKANPNDEELLVAAIFNSKSLRAIREKVRDPMIKGVCVTLSRNKLLKNEYNEIIEMAQKFFEAVNNAIQLGTLLEAHIGRFSICLGRAFAASTTEHHLAPGIIEQMTKQTWKYFHIFVSELQNACVSSSLAEGILLGISKDCNPDDSAIAWLCTKLDSVGTERVEKFHSSNIAMRVFLDTPLTDDLTSPEAKALIKNTPLINEIVTRNCAKIFAANLGNCDELLSCDVKRAAIMLVSCNDKTRWGAVSRWLDLKNPAYVLDDILSTPANAVLWPYLSPLVDQLIEIGNFRDAKSFIDVYGKLNSLMSLSQRIDVLRRLSGVVFQSKL